MEIYPAIDLCGHKVVRLAQGDYARQTTYSDDPKAVAEGFVAAGCRWIHVVDLDAARSGEPVNLQVAADLAAGLDVRIELGGGMRNDAVIGRALDAGIARVIVGSAALEDWPWFEGLLGREDMAERIALGLDARGGKLATRGWLTQTDARAVDFARRVAGTSLGAIVYTDIDRDGVLTGVNTAATAEVIAATDVDVVAAGGVASLGDLTACREIGCAGAVIGRAYYEGRIDLAEALAAVS